MTKTINPVYEYFELAAEVKKNDHNRLEKDLKEWAKSKGFTIELKNFPNDSNPDVLYQHKTMNWLFCGDAKNADNETSSNTKTCARILDYFMEFRRSLGPNGFNGGILAIATNSKREAILWETKLNELAKKAGIRGSKGSSPNFSTHKVPKKNTWIIYW